MEPMTSSAPSIVLLLIEDEEVTKELLSIVLARKFPDLALHTAANGRMGLELYKTYSPDIVITDINMPEMDGMQMAEKIRLLRPETKIIAITGRDADLMPQVSGKDLQFDHVIVKPVIYQELFDAIEQCRQEIALQT
jgi:YesN/AraC family two-component response regulator